MKSAVAGLSLSAVVATAAYASPFEDFQKLCVQTSGDAASALAAADASGWGAAPKALLAEWRENKGATNVQGRSREIGRKRQFLLVKDADLGGEMQVHDCGVHTVPGDEDYAHQVVNWIGVPPMTSDTDRGVKSTIYMFEIEGAERKPLSSNADSAMIKVVAERRLRLVHVNESAEGTSISIAVPWKVELR